MRKLRRLPWRIPKSHNNQQPAPAPVSDTSPRVEHEPRPPLRETLDTQPVAFAGGRYVYGMAPSVPCTTEIRRKTRHRTLTPFVAAVPR